MAFPLLCFETPMKKNLKYWSLMVIVALSLGLACGDSGDDGPDSNDNFDRSAMLANWADNFIVPSYDLYFQSLTNLQLRKDELLATTNMDALLSMRQAFVDAYMVWQSVSMFEIGKTN